MVKLRKRQRQPRRFQIFKRGPYTIKLGRFKASQICLDEACINNVVLRVKIEGNVKVKEKHKVENSNFLKNVDLKQMIRRSFRTKILNEKDNEKNGICTPNNKSIKPLQNVFSSDKRYYLVFQPYKHSYDCKVTVNFGHLSQRVCFMKLPSRSWRVTVMMNSDLKTVFTFSNHKPLRCVTFSETNPYFKIVMEGVPVMLIGCPKIVATVKDIEVLLDIVNNISLTDCMVLKI